MDNDQNITYETICSLHNLCSYVNKCKMPVTGIHNVHITKMQVVYVVWSHQEFGVHISHANSNTFKESKVSKVELNVGNFCTKISEFQSVIIIIHLIQICMHTSLIIEFRKYSWWMHNHAFSGITRSTHKTQPNPPIHTQNKMCIHICKILGTPLALNNYWKGKCSLMSKWTDLFYNYNLNSRS